MKTKSALFAPLRHELFCKLWLAQIFSNLGTWMHAAGAAWLMTTLSSSPEMIADVQLAATLPVFLLVVPAGVVADSMDRPRYLFYVQTFMATIALAIGLTTISGAISPLLLLTLTFLLGCGSAMNMPAWQAATASLVPRAEIPAAASLNNMSNNFGRVLGPVIGGLLIAAIGIGSLFLVNALSFVGILFVFYKWHKTPHTSVISTVTLRESFLEGIGLIKGSSEFRIFLANAFTIYFFQTAIWVLIPLYSRAELHLSPQQFGIIFAFLGVGAMSAAPLLSYLRAPVNTKKIWADKNILTLSCFLLSAGFVCLAIVPIFSAALAAIAVCGLSYGIAVSVQNGQVQSSFEANHRARAVAFYLMLFYGGMASGSFIFGKIAAAYQCRSTFLIAAAGVSIYGCVRLAWRLLNK